MVIVSDTCCLCGDHLIVKDKETSYVISKTFIYKGKKFKGKRSYFHKKCYEKLLPRYAGLTQSVE